MRLLAGLLGLLSALLLPFAITAAWAERAVTDTGAYVDAVGPLADEPAVQDAVAQRLTAVVDDRLAGSPLASGGAAAGLTAEASQVAVSSEAFGQVWRRGNAALHRQLTASLESERPGGRDGLVLRLDPLVDEVLRAVALDLGLPAPPDVDAPLALRVGSSSDAERAAQGYRLVDASSPALPVVWAAVLVLALLPRGRRGTLVVAAVASVLTCLALWLAVPAGGDVAARALDARTFVLGEDVARLVYDGVTAGLRTWALLAAGVAALVLVVALLLPRARAR